MIWYVYISAAVISTLVSLVTFARKQPAGTSWADIIVGYYFSDADSILTSVGTFSFIWLLGSIYIDDLPIPYTSWIADLPTKNVVAFCLGFLGEWAGPLLLKAVIQTIVSWIKSKGKE